jgi:hypothetical protein
VSTNKAYIRAVDDAHVTFRLGLMQQNNNAIVTDGAIMEVVITQTDNSVATRQKIEGYLAWKWGLEGNLPSGHPYKNAAPTQ